MYRLVAHCLAIPLFAVVPRMLAQDAPKKVWSGVMAEQFVTKVVPVYPPEARIAGVQGTVVMHAIIGKTGTIESLDVLSGPEALRSSALDAVRQWTYKPYLLNGNPVAVDTTITISYSWSRPAPVERIRVSSGVMSGLAKTRKIPEYPEAAIAAHEVGAVVLHAVIDTTGKVIQLDRMSGPKIFSQAVMDAVWQWTYKPYLINGEPVEVETQIAINFSHGASV